MSASLKMHSAVLKRVRQANPREDLRRQRVFAGAVTVLILTGCVSLTEWSVMVVTRVQAASTFRRLWRFLGNAHIDVASYYRPFFGAALAGWVRRRERRAHDRRPAHQARSELAANWPASHPARSRSSPAHRVEGAPQSSPGSRASVRIWDSVSDLQRLHLRSCVSSGRILDDVSGSQGMTLDARTLPLDGSLDVFQARCQAFAYRFVADLEEQTVEQA